MIKSSVEKLSEVIGFDIGISDDITQGNLLNGFCKGLSNSMLQKSDLAMQLCSIADKLDDNSARVLIELAEYIRLKENNK